MTPPANLICLEHRAAECHHRRALDLAAYGVRIHDRAALVTGDQPGDANLAAALDDHLRGGDHSAVLFQPAGNADTHSRRRLAPALPADVPMIGLPADVLGDRPEHRRQPVIGEVA